jgi:hypothetical protein
MVCTIFVQCFDPNEWGLKNSFRSVGLNPCPFGSSALTKYHCSHTITIVHYLQWKPLIVITLGLRKTKTLSEWLYDL